MTHQPAISFSISIQHLFNRAGGRTSNVRAKMKSYRLTPDLHSPVQKIPQPWSSVIRVGGFGAPRSPRRFRFVSSGSSESRTGDFSLILGSSSSHLLDRHRADSHDSFIRPASTGPIPDGANKARLPTGHKLFNHTSTTFQSRPLERF